MKYRTHLLHDQPEGIDVAAMASWTLHRIAHLFDRSKEAARYVLRDAGARVNLQGNTRWNPKTTMSQVDRALVQS
jgi:hypothetical protein